MRGAANARARSSTRDAILLTRTLVRPFLVSTKSGSTPNWVIVGPRLISTTCTGALNDASVSSINLARCWINSSLTEGAEPGDRMFFTSGNCQLMIASADLTVVIGTPSFGTAINGSGRFKGVNPLDATSMFSGAVDKSFSVLRYANRSRTLATSGLTH